MEAFLALLKAAGFDKVEDALKALATTKTSLATANTEHSALKESIGITDDFTPEMAKALIEAGRKFRDGLVEAYVKARRVLGRTEDTPEATAAAKALIANWSLDQLQAEAKTLTDEARKNFPEEFTPEAQEDEKQEEGKGDKTGARRFRKIKKA